MKLTQTAIEAIDINPIRLKLALGLEFTETWVRDLIKDNKENGPLTTAKALQVIRQETGLTDDAILTEESELKSAS